MNLRLTALAACGLLLAPAALAQKPVPRSPLEIGQDLAAESVMLADGSMSLDARTGAPTGLFGLDFAAQAATPEAAAREFLAAYAAPARLAAADVLEHVATTSGPAGHAVRFRQTVGGVPVLGSDVVVNVTAGNRVPFALLDLRRGVSVPTTAPALTAEAARAAVFAHLGVEGTLHLDQTALVVAPTEEGARLAWQVRVMADAPSGEWEGLVDAGTGELFRVADRMLYHRGGEGGGDDGPAIPTVEAAMATVRTVDAPAMVFVPDPLTRAGATYGQAGYVDGSDADTPQLTAARTAVTLRDITFQGGQYHLTGPWTNYLDWASPLLGTFPQATPDWSSFTRSPDAFEAANVYYHIDTFMRYVNETLGITVRPFQAGTNGLVPFDAHGFNGADNSSYSGGTARLQFGEGGVDDSEDADVIIHELGHGLHHWLALAGPSQVNGLSEGTGDYLAASYTRAFGLLTAASPAYNWVFKWDGHNPFWGGRSVAYGALYPGGLTGQIHTDGQIWATVNMQIWNDIGGLDTDRAFLEGLRLTTGTSNQPQAAQAVLQAARNMGYDQADLDAMFARYTARGYSVTMPPPPVASEGGPSAGTFELAAAAPNPATGRASLLLRSDRAQTVEVVLVDVLGRHVATLFAGAVGANEGRSLEVDVAALPAGLYVVRATGEAGTAVRSLTVAR